MRRWILIWGTFILSYSCFTPQIPALKKKKKSLHYEDEFYPQSLSALHEKNDTPFITMLLTITKHLTLTDSNWYPCPTLFLVTTFYCNLCERWGGNQYGRNLISACCKGKVTHNMLLQSWFFFFWEKKFSLETSIYFIVLHKILL